MERKKRKRNRASHSLLPVDAYICERGIHEQGIIAFPEDGQRMSYRRRCGAIMLKNSLEVMILVFFQKAGKWRWFPVIR